MGCITNLLIIRFEMMMMGKRLVKSICLRILITQVMKWKVNFNRFKEDLTQETRNMIVVRWTL